MIAWAAPAVALAAIVAGLVAFVRLPPRSALGVLLIAIAVALAIYRMVAIAGPLALFGYALLRSGGSQPVTPSPGQTSEVRTDALSMWLDHDTGEMDGEVLNGPLEGRHLSDMPADELQELVHYLETTGDEDSLSLILAYLERRGDTAGETEGTAPQSEMSETEAYRVLGLDPGASTEEVRAAHKRLIRKVHPDLGGSSLLAAMINAAKEKLDPS
ncbi:MAG: DnaJ domain-containing protein [Pseudomonadota bacterium]